MPSQLLDEDLEGNEVLYSVATNCLLVDRISYLCMILYIYLCMIIYNLLYLLELFDAEPKLKKLLSIFVFLGVVYLSSRYLPNFFLIFIIKICIQIIILPDHQTTTHGWFVDICQLLAMFQCLLTVILLRNDTRHDITR